MQKQKELKSLDEKKEKEKKVIIEEYEDKLMKMSKKFDTDIDIFASLLCLWTDDFPVQLHAKEVKQF